MSQQVQMQARVEAMEQALELASTDTATALAGELVRAAAALPPGADAAHRAVACRAILAASTQFSRAGQHRESAAALSIADALSNALAPTVVAAVRLRRVEEAVQQHDIGAALDALAPLLTFTRQNGLPIEEARAWNCYGLAMQAAGLHELADGLFERALRLVEGMHLPRETADFWQCRLQLKAYESAPALAAARHACQQVLAHALASGPRLSDATAATSLPLAATGGSLLW